MTHHGDHKVPDSWDEEEFTAWIEQVGPQVDGLMAEPSGFAIHHIVRERCCLGYLLREAGDGPTTCSRSLMRGSLWSALASLSDC